MSLQDPQTAAYPDPRSLANLPPIFDLHRIVAKVFEEIGLGAVSVSPIVDERPAQIDFSVLHFVIMPERSAWLDLILEIDRPSALKIYEIFSGEPTAADSDLADVLREIMNLVHGSLKSAFKAAGVDVIIPIVPQSIDTERVPRDLGGYSLHSRHVFRAEGMTLRFTLIARVAPINRKELRELCVAEVLLDPLTAASIDPHVLVKKHTMLNRRTLAKIRQVAEGENDARTHAVFEPSPLATLIPND